MIDFARSVKLCSFGLALVEGVDEKETRGCGENCGETSKSCREHWMYGIPNDRTELCLLKPRRWIICLVIQISQDSHIHRKFCIDMFQDSKFLNDIVWFCIVSLVSRGWLDCYPWMSREWDPRNDREWGLRHQVRSSLGDEVALEHHQGQWIVRPTRSTSSMLSNSTAAILVCPKSDGGFKLSLIWSNGSSMGISKNWSWLCTPSGNLL